MVRFIETPHLPKSTVKHIIIGEKYRNLLENALIKNNLEPIWLPDNPCVDERLSGHVDLSAVHLGKNRLALTEHFLHCEFINELGIDCIPVKNQASLNYPNDAIYNVCVVGKYRIANTKTASRELSDLLGDKQLVSCRQGYSKCSVCVVDENSILTSDKGIADAASKAGLDVLMICDGLVRLDGFACGFIGGASFKIDRNKIAFTGMMKNEDQKNNIERFLHERDIEVIYLTDEEIFDIGSAIPLTERKTIL